MDQADFDLVLTLSAREFEVFVELGRGQRTTEIAELLFLSRKTVETHVANSIAKLGVKHSPGLRALATRYLVFEESQGLKRVPRVPKALAAFKFERAA